jgi:hypothetical protein
MVWIRICPKQSMIIICVASIVHDARRDLSRQIYQCSWDEIHLQLSKGMVANGFNISSPNVNQFNLKQYVDYDLQEKGQGQKEGFN